MPDPRLGMGSKKVRIDVKEEMKIYLELLEKFEKT